MPLPIFADWASSRRSSALHRHQEQPRNFRAPHSWELDIVDDMNLLSGTFPSDFDSVGGMLRYPVVSSQESNSEDSSSSSSDDLSLEQDTNERVELDASRRRHEVLPTMNLTRSSSFLAAAQEDRLSDSHDSPIPSELIEEERELLSLMGRRRFPAAGILRGDAFRFPEVTDRPLGNSDFTVQPRLPFITRRLLLSSARQNTRNENTLIDMHHDNNTMQPGGPGLVSEAVPLRRQNAIRRLTTSLPSATFNKKASSLKKMLKKFLQSIKEHDPAFGTSPLFTDNHIWNNSLFPISHYRSQQNDPYSIEDDMNYVLLWQKSRNRWQKNIVVDDPEQGAFHDMRMKRKYALETSSTRKKMKSRSSSNAGLENKKYSSFRDHRNGDSIFLSELSRANKILILNGLLSSLFRSGSKFSVGFDPLLPSGHDVLEMAMTNVCHGDAQLDGFFQPAADNDNRNLFHLKIFLTILIGNTRMNDGRLLRDLLEVLFCAIASPKMLSDSQKKRFNFRIPFTGALINFKDQDLRFLQGDNDDGSVTQRSSNSRIGLQMAEWLKINPFTQLTEAFFLNRLKFSINCLKNLPEIPKKHQKAIFEFCKNLIDESWLLTKSFSLLRLSQIRAIKNSFESYERNFAGESRQVNFSRSTENNFIRKWNSELCNKLGDFAGCADSCLLNLQLNYVLFTVEIDIHKSVSAILDTISRDLPPSVDRELLTEIVSTHQKERVANEKSRTILICSLDRKTGRLELLKVDSDADFKIPGAPRRYSVAHDPSDSYGGTPWANLNNSNIPHEGTSFPYPPTFGERDIMFGVPKQGSADVTNWKEKDNFLGYI
ncbi:hypothetical protein METBIDRAFT_9833 [Metschnikowia bicuspidata var. bicuspidata NRRL YB-4993]|uniref:Uncharacterized protein n=1 Tax=Metschnikowia bicuspidata var. bicuspidata NRRL YB-4993 TaxID=869754 RepID=A0A1A0HHU9_9ASCO|nr:hypothetical protein METBIDRAFT_9833 [Metschnikowia bicuspidata var. bicuspidata NRRL YB-4993]OBA23585.1 hypothetical protein METBIDRAFT_9833 [Metschnikowia bicuspidata var. bicuspidata NRRL YB-4993]